MYRIHKWKEKGQSAVQNPKQPPVWFNLLVQLAVQLVHGRAPEGEKTDPHLSKSPIFLLYNTQSVDLVSQVKNLSRVKQMHTQRRWHFYCAFIQGKGIQATLLIGAGRVSAPEQYPEVVWNIFMLVHPLDLF